MPEVNSEIVARNKVVSISTNGNRVDVVVVKVWIAPLESVVPSLVGSVLYFRNFEFLLVLGRLVGGSELFLLR